MTKVKNMTSMLVPNWTLAHVPLAAFLLVTLCSAANTPAALPTITSVMVPSTRPFGASNLDLPGQGYVEQEFYVSGLVNRYRIKGPMETADIIDSGHPYKSRIIVRRPIDSKKFNGIVVVEWYNVTTGQDVDFAFAALHEHLIAAGYAYVAVSAQLVGIETLRRVDAKRYGSLQASASNIDPLDGGNVDTPSLPSEIPRPADVLSWDIFGQVGAALRAPRGVAMLGGLKAKNVIAIGESQSALRLTTYYNAIEPIHHVYDGFLTYDRAGPLRDDTGVKSISVGTEFLATMLAGPPPNDSPSHRWWEVAGASHLSFQDIAYEDPIVKRDGALRSPNGQPLSMTEIVDAGGQCSEHPLWSRVPTGEVLASALEQLIIWINGGPDPIMVERLGRDSGGALLRDKEGLVSGGIRLPAFEAPLADNGAANSGPGFCRLAGHHRDFSESELCDRYGSRESFLARQRSAATAAFQQRFVLQASIDRTLHDAEAVAMTCAKF